jgi:hypothetical protein
MKLPALLRTTLASPARNVRSVLIVLRETGPIGPAEELDIAPKKWADDDCCREYHRREGCAKTAQHDTSSQAAVLSAKRGCKRHDASTAQHCRQGAFREHRQTQDGTERETESPWVWWRL